jgi:hypothetical protein
VKMCIVWLKPTKPSLTTVSNRFKDLNQEDDRSVY